MCLGRAENLSEKMSIEYSSVQDRIRRGRHINTSSDQKIIFVFSLFPHGQAIAGRGGGKLVCFHQKLII
jgi:hypothetical protein